MSSETKDEEVKPVIGLYGLAVMGQNLALNIASKGFPIAVCNRSPAKIDVTVQRAKDEGNLPLVGIPDLAEFVGALTKPRRVIILVKAGKPVDAVIEQLAEVMEVCIPTCPLLGVLLYTSLLPTHANQHARVVCALFSLVSLSLRTCLL